MVALSIAAFTEVIPSIAMAESTIVENIAENEGSFAMAPKQAITGTV